MAELSDDLDKIQSLSSIHTLLYVILLLYSVVVWSYQYLCSYI